MIAELFIIAVVVVLATTIYAVIVTIACAWLLQWFLLWKIPEVARRANAKAPRAT